MAGESLRLSVIIPCRNDAAALAETLPGLLAGLREGDEIIVANAGGAPAFTAVPPEGVRVVECRKTGRGQQMNEGAAAATGDVFIFNHADTGLTAAHLASIRHCLAAPGALAGAFFKDTAFHYPAWAWADRIIRWWMGHCGVVYGDQTVFLRRGVFAQLGGFAPIPLMEDVEMSPRLRRTGGFRLIDPPLRTSMRRFERQGRVWTRLKNLFYVLLFRSGVSAERLYEWYYGKPVDSGDTRS